MPNFESRSLALGIPRLFDSVSQPALAPHSQTVDQANRWLSNRHCDPHRDAVWSRRWVTLCNVFYSCNISL